MNNTIRNMITKRQMLRINATGDTALLWRRFFDHWDEYVAYSERVTGNVEDFALAVAVQPHPMREARRLDLHVGCLGQV